MITNTIIGLVSLWVVSVLRSIVISANTPSVVDYFKE